MKRFSFLILLIFAFMANGLMAENHNPQILIKTTLGTIEVELYAKKAPVTVGNFLQYIKENRWNGASFYRTVTMQNQPHNKVKIEVIQGGLGDDTTQMLPPIKMETTQETGIHHLNGTISMARDKPNSATSEFFICVGKQPSLDYGGKRNPDGQGFAAFGRVVKGMTVVKKIQQQPAKGQVLTPPIRILSIQLIK